ncbi:MAG: hypothetical protein BJ554DRAFT_4082 [Olpidium bornovanus]|uniref:Uncharacterized protein n=1 Tax=Olpidium bornovanus TaxID=278681 RepID=A0A8H8DLH1_9FUNG|nr:MAG: hypothetical protein BJ554DRAFT_4082 [Olpidium bornovanus]
MKAMNGNQDAQPPAWDYRRLEISSRSRVRLRFAGRVIPSSESEDDLPAHLNFRPGLPWFERVGGESLPRDGEEGGSERGDRQFSNQTPIVEVPPPIPRPRNRPARLSAESAVPVAFARSVISKFPAARQFFGTLRAQPVAWSIRCSSETLGRRNLRSHRP